MTKGAVIYEKGSPDVFKWENIDVPDPKFDEVLIKNTAVGVNYIDTYHRRGMPHPWPVPDLPIVLGIEGVGIVEDIGSDIIDFKKGDRVAYASMPIGSYSTHRIFPTKKLVKVPDKIEFKDVVTLMTKGFTVFYLLHKTYQVKTGEHILFHAAAG